MRANGRIPFRIYRPGMVVGHSQDRRHRQDRRAVLLLQGAAEAARVLAALDAAGRHRGRLHQRRAGRLRRRRDRPPRAPARTGRPLLPPHRPEAAARRRGAERVRARGARAGDGDPHRPEACSRWCPSGVTQAIERSKPLQNVFDQLLRDLQVPRAVLQFVNYPTRFDSSATQKLLDKAARSACRRSRTTRGGCGTTGSATSTRTCSIDRSLSGAVKRQGRADHRRLVGHRRGDGDPHRGGRRQGDHRRARRGEARRRSRQDHRRAAATCKHVLLRHHRPAPRTTSWRTTCSRSSARVDVLINNAGRSIRRSIEPVIRPLPRLRAHDAAQLLRVRAPDDEPAAVDDGAPKSATSSTSPRSAC